MTGLCFASSSMRACGRGGSRRRGGLESGRLRVCGRLFCLGEARVETIVMAGRRVMHAG
jgi:hypothetical protein